MTRSQIITALVLVMVICLGLSALLLPERDGRTPTPTRLVAFSPSEVEALEVRLPSGAQQKLTRVAPDRWEIRLGETSRWPASTERVRAFLRILDRARGLPATESPPPASTTLTITSNLGEAVRLGLPATSLGGRSVILVEPQSPPDPHANPHPVPHADPHADPFITTDELPRLLGAEGILHWLDARAFAGIEGQVRAITVTSAAETMRIVRAGSSQGTGWRLEAPFAAPAEGSLVAELLAGLQSLPFASPRPPTGDTEPPAADATTITLTTTIRRPGPDGSIATETIAHRLTTTGPVGQSGQVPVVLLAEAFTPDAPRVLGPLAATIDAARLGEIVRPPSFYIARRAVAAEPADIQSLTLTLPDSRTLRLARSAGGTGWTIDGEPVSGAEGVAIEAVVVLLTRTPAVVAVHTGEPGEGLVSPSGPVLPPTAQHLATIAAHGLGGLTLASVDLAVAPLPDAADDGRAYALLVGGPIARYYQPESAVEAVRWVAGLTPQP